MSKIVARLLPLLVLVSILSGTADAQSQRPLEVKAGDAVVAGFSGTVAPDPAKKLPPGKTAIDLTFIDPDGPAARLVDLRAPGFVWDARLFAAPKPFDVFARDTGQVFGVAFDNRPQPNIYLAATSAYGLQLVGRGRDGSPERRKVGGAGTGWMKGQFGVELGGDPGSIYKVDGTTGVVTLFARVLLNSVPNPGPALGNLAYDAAHEQLFVSDLYTGMIHRFAIADGSEPGAPYDHGVIGRRAANLAAMPFDASKRPNVAKRQFDTLNPNSWGFAPPERRVWGLAVHGDRLFYSTRNGSKSEAPQIWSVGILRDGGFASDPRWELDVPAQSGPYPVTDIAFSARGAMILAQRAPAAGSYDYKNFTKPGAPRVLRYWLENPDDPKTPSRWIAVPEEYAVGFADTYRNATGGVDLGYGYDKNGGFNGACEGSLVVTGEKLRLNDKFKDRLQPGGPFRVDGLQIAPVNAVLDANSPPWTAYFVDYDDKFDDAAVTGWIGGVRVYRTPCVGGTAASEDAGAAGGVAGGGGGVIIGGSGGIGGGGSGGGCVGPKCPRRIDLGIKKTASGGKYDEKTGAWTYQFTLSVTNLGNPFFPQNFIAINDPAPSGITFTAASGTNWTCPAAQFPVTNPNALNCTYNFGPGQIATNAVLNPLIITVTVAQAGTYLNCATVGTSAAPWLHETTLSNNRDCAGIKVPLDVGIHKDGGFSTVADMPPPNSSSITYHLTVTNITTPFVGAGAIVVNDPPPAGVTYTSVSVTPSGNWLICGLVSGSVNCVYNGPGPTAPNQFLGTITVTAIAKDPGPWTNCAVVTVDGGAGTDSNLDNNKACMTLTKPVPPDIALAKSFAVGPTTGSGAYTFHVTNVGGDIAAGATLTINDPVPAGVTFTGFGGTSAANWSCIPIFPVTGASPMTCTYTGTGVFPAGSALPDLVINATLAADGSETGIYQNCATVGATAGGAPVTETDMTNNTACAVTNTINTQPCVLGTPPCPRPAATCNQDVLLIVDNSPSIPNIGQVRQALKNFLLAMKDKGGSVDIFTFNNAPWIPISTGWTAVTTANLPTLNSQIGTINTGGTRTNWDDALHHGFDVVTAHSTPKPLVIFVTDGEPTAYDLGPGPSYGTEVSASSQPVTASTEAVTWINQIRGAGSPLIAVGFGPVSTAGFLDAAFGGTSSGPSNVNLTTSSVIKMSDVSYLPGVMAALGNQMCGTLSLNKSGGGYFDHIIPQGGGVSVNDTVPFTLTLTNNAATPVSGIVVQDQVPSVLSAPTLGTPSLGTTNLTGNLIAWSIPQLLAHQTATLSFNSKFAKHYTAAAYETYTNYAQLFAALNYTATQLNNMNPVSGPVTEVDESLATFTENIHPYIDPCAGPTPPTSCFLTVDKQRTNPGAEDTSCTSSASGGTPNPCPFTISVGLNNIPAGSTITVTDALTLNNAPVTWPGTFLLNGSQPPICTGVPPTLIGFTCTHTPLSGSSASLSNIVTVTIPTGQTGTLQNCVTVTVTNTTTTPPFNVTATACATVANPVGLIACPQGGGGPAKSNRDCGRATSIDLKTTKVEIRPPVGMPAGTHWFDITIGNGAVPFSYPAGLITVTDNVPAGMTVTSAMGTNWLCGPPPPPNVVGPASFSCSYTHAGTLAANGSLPPILVKSITAPGPGTLAQCATVMVDGGTGLVDSNPNNNQSCVKVSPPPRKIDLKLIKREISHEGPPGSHWFDLMVSNAGPAFTYPGGAITVTDTVPAGLNVSSATGTGWTCLPPAVSGPGSFTCTYNPSGSLPLSGTLPPIVVQSMMHGQRPVQQCAAVGVTAGSGLTDPDFANNKSCVTVRTQVAPPVCPLPKVMDRAGRCDCPDGTKPQGRNCVAVHKPPACQPPMVSGAVLGQCFCPTGTVQRGRDCVRQTSCQPPATLNQRGGCDCPQGTIMSGNRCVQQDHRQQPGDVIRGNPGGAHPAQGGKRN
ncbi:MAG TPA: hypothetical protein VIJ42_16960 [Stellaceae bacterium]